MLLQRCGGGYFKRRKPEKRLVGRRRRKELPGSWRLGQTDPTTAPTAQAVFQTTLGATKLQVSARSWDRLPVPSSAPLGSLAGVPRAPFLGLCPLNFDAALFPS